MFWSVFWASVHYLSILMLFGFLYGELLLWRTGISERNIRTLLWLDIGYGLSALAVLVSGIARAGWTEKGWDFYLSNPWFHGKVTLFILIGLLSLYPTKVLLGWRKTVKAGHVPEIDATLQRNLRGVLVAELHLVVLMPILAALMARGVGMGV
ncbi:MAG: DUF2214 family protein [Alcanivorax sp.]|jgi:putative membrane protein|uniref:DUF2214 family protein n=1 Tax=Alcanivorax sp. TaxID=1872427 RepID=UPI0019BD6909|nr:DUF2214 family protein [Alcanivorax sp.]MBD3643683.1 DUF2214 family protein [Alcanivorax sp.]MDF1722928.1 DUF2214 family protein [Alcanivorax sp.]